MVGGEDLSSSARERTVTVRIRKRSQAVVAHAFNPSTWEAEAGDLSKFEASLVYKMSSSTDSKATEKHCLKTPKKKKRKENMLDSDGSCL